MRSAFWLALTVVGVATFVSGCAAAARIDIHPMPEQSSASDVRAAQTVLDGYLRTRGYALVSESNSRSARDHATYLKNLPPLDGISILEIWEKSVGSHMQRVRLEVQLQAIPRGFGITVSSDAPNGANEAKSEARTLKEFLDSAFPGQDIKMQTWRSFIPA